MTCKRCGESATAVTPYWARDGHRLCRPCCVQVAALLDELDRWPPVPWGDDEVPADR